MVAAAVVISAAVLFSASLYQPKTALKTTTVTETFVQTVIVLSTETSASCDYVLPGPCINGQTFTLSVNYTGAWRITCQGYNTAGCLGCYDSSTQTLSGNYDGSGYSARNITVGGQSNGWTLCAQAQKSDSSSSALILDVSGARNETSIPFGTASACSEELLG